MGGSTSSSSASAQRIAGFAGIAFAVLFVAGLALGGDGPVYDDPATEVREFFMDSDTQVHLSTLLGSVALVFLLLPFAAGLRNLLAAAEPPGAPMWSRLSFAGAVISVAIGLPGFAFWEVLSQGVAEDLSDGTLVALARFDTVIFIGLWPWSLALFSAAGSLVILRSGVLARWIGWLGAAAAVLLVVGTLWIFTEDDESVLAAVAYVGLPLTAVWVLAVSVSMLRAAHPGGSTSSARVDAAPDRVPVTDHGA